MGKISSGFGLAVKKFGTSVVTGTDNANKRYGLGGGLTDMLTKGRNSVMGQFKTGLGDNIKPIFTKVGNQATSTAQTILEKADAKNKLHDIASDFGFTKGAINGIYKEQAKDLGVQGFNPSSLSLKSLGDLNLTNVNITENLNPSSYLPSGGVSSIDPMAMAEQAGIGNKFGDASAMLKQVDINKFMDGGISSLSIGGKDTNILSQNGIPTDIDISKFSNTISNSTSDIKLEFENPIDLDTVSNNFNTDTFNVDVLSSASNIDEFDASKLEIPDFTDVKDVTSGSNNPMDSINWGYNYDQNMFNDLHNIGDSEKDYTKNIREVVGSEDYLYAITDTDNSFDKFMSDDFAYESLGMSEDKLFGPLNNGSSSMEGAIFTNINLDMATGHSSTLSKQYTEMWGSDAASWSDSMADAMGGDITSFKTKIKIKSIWEEFGAGTSNKDWIRDLRFNVAEGIHKLFHI